jgi:pyruvate/2-oxoacid:ferredoxin oxidoreductase beta subunit
MLSPCPTGWKSEPTESVDLVRYAVGCGLFPVYEVFDGVRYRINVRPDGTPLDEYLSRQRRYTAASIDKEVIESEIRQQWAYLEGLERAFPALKDE